MRYYGDICLRYIIKESKHSHSKSKSHNDFEKYEHIKLSLKNVDIKDVDEILYLYMLDHNKKFNQYLIKGQYKLVFNNDQDCKYLMTHIINITTNFPWSNFLRDAISILKTEGYHFNYIAEMDIITIAHTRDMIYDFYLKNKMLAFEWKLNGMINREENLIIKFPRIWRHPINMKFNCYLINNN